ncbi:MAG: CIA30 family protein [Cyanobacteria bacterium P01_F01_bin.53]
MTSDGRSQWSVARFLSTLNYFGEVPFLGSFRWVQQFLGQSPVIPGMAMGASKKTVVVISDGSARSSEVFKALGNRCSNDVELITYVLGDDFPVGEASLRIHSGSERALAFRRLIRSADTVALLDGGGDGSGDGWRASDVSKVLADVQACLNCQTMSPFTAQSGVVSSTVERIVFDFAAPGCDLAAWGALDDVVMGGVSQGSIFLKTLEQTPGHDFQVAMFAGYVSTDNSGGFSSVRTRNFDPPFDFSGWEGVRLRVKGDGQRYKFIARNSGGWDSPAYIYSFDAVADTWLDIEVPFSAMVATFRARSVPNAPAFDPSRVFSLQLMLSKFEHDRRLNPQFMAGPFELAVSGLSVYRPRQGVPLVVVGVQDESVRSQQQLMLNEAQMNYRFIEPGSTDIIDALMTTLT